MLSTVHLKYRWAIALLLSSFYNPAIVSAQVILVDFGRTDTITEGNYNNIGGNGGSNSSSNADPDDGGVSLIDDAGVDSGITLILDISAGGTWANSGADYSGPYPDAISSEPDTALRDGLNLVGEALMPEITLSGLDPTATYDLLFYSARGNNGGGFTYTSTGANGDVEASIADVQSNATLTAEAIGMVPDSSGEIAIVITKEDGGARGGLNYMRIVPGGGDPFAITGVSADSSDSKATIAWPSSIGQQYAIDSSNDLLSWEEIGSVPGESESTSFTQPTDASMQYWRVRKVDAPPFLETSFEDGIGDWTISGEGTAWEVGAPTSGPSAANTGVGVAATGLTGDYADGTAVQLRTPVIDPGITEQVKLEFWYYLQAAQGDGGQISLLEADGTLIEHLEQLYLGGEDDTTEWTPVNLRLPKLEPARPFILQFALLSVDDGNPSNGTGWLIDDVRIGK